MCIAPSAQPGRKRLASASRAARIPADLHTGLRGPGSPGCRARCRADLHPPARRDRNSSAARGTCRVAPSTPNLYDVCNASRSAIPVEAGVVEAGYARRVPEGHARRRACSIPFAEGARWQRKSRLSIDLSGGARTIAGVRDARLLCLVGLYMPARDTKAGRKVPPLRNGGGFPLGPPESAC